MPGMRGRANGASSCTHCTQCSLPIGSPCLMISRNPGGPAGALCLRARFGTGEQLLSYIYVAQYRPKHSRPTEPPPLVPMHLLQIGPRSLHLPAGISFANIMTLPQRPLLEKYSKSSGPFLQPTLLLSQASLSQLKSRPSKSTPCPAHVLPFTCPRAPSHP